MRISQINVNYGFGSTGIIVRDLQELCLRNNIDCEGVYFVAVGLIKDEYQIGN